MRWTPPMKAPRPPPTTRSRRRRPAAPGVPFRIDISTQPQQPAIRGNIDATGREVVECARHHLDDVALDEGGALGCSLFAVLDAALPLQDGPTVETVLRQLRED